MPVTVDARHNQGAFSGVTSVSWNHTVGSGLTRSIVCALISTGVPPSSAPTFGGTAATKFGSVALNGGQEAEIWYVLSPPAGVASWSVSFPSTTDCVLGSASYQFVNQSTPWNAAGPQTGHGNTGSGGSESLTVTSQTNEMAVAATTVAFTSGTPSPSGSQTQISQGNNGISSIAGASEDLAGASSVSMGWSGADVGSEYGIVGGSLVFDAGSTDVTPGVGALTLTGYAPAVVASGVNPGTGQLILTGYAPSVLVGGPIAMPGTGQLVLTGYAPFVSVPGVPTRPIAVSFAIHSPGSGGVGTPAGLGIVTLQAPASPPAATPTPSAPTIPYPSFRLRVPNPPERYDFEDQRQFRRSIQASLEAASQALVQPNTDIVVQVTQLAPSPSSDAGFNVRFNVDAQDPLGTTCQVEIVSLEGNGVVVVAGPAVGVPSPNDQVWRVSLPFPGIGGGPGTMLVRGISGDGGRHTDVVVPLPQQTTQGIPQGTVSIATNGSWSASITIPANAQSAYVLGSTSGYPTVVQAITTGTLITNATSPIQIASPTYGPALVFGQTEYITVVAATDPGGNINTILIPQINIQGSYVSFGPSKTANYAASQFAPEYTGGPGYVLYSSAEASLRPNPLANLTVYDFDLFPVLPNTVTITQIAVNGYWSSGIPEGGMGVFWDRITGTTTTNVGSASATNVGWQLLTFSSLNESTVGHSYRIRAHFTGPASSAEIGVGSVAITYTQTDPSTNL